MKGARVSTTARNGRATPPPGDDGVFKPPRGTVARPLSGRDDDAGFDHGE